MKTNSKWQLLVLYGAWTALVSCDAYAVTAAEKKKYELANVIKGLMVNVGAHDFYYTDIKKYSKNNQFVSNDVKKSKSTDKPYGTEEYSVSYEGKMPLYLHGLRFIAENMEDDNLWNVKISGSHALPMKVYFDSTQSEINLNGGPKYFRSNGIILKPIACHIDGPGNYLIYYRANVHGKKSIILEIMASSGSGGGWYSYGVHWTDYVLKHLPFDVTVGECIIND